MSVATLFAAMVFTGTGRLERRARGFLLANGLLLPFIALQTYVHWLIWIAALWAVTFPGATWSLAELFRGMRPEDPARPETAGSRSRTRSGERDVRWPETKEGPHVLEEPRGLSGPG